MRFAPTPEQREFAASLRELLAKADVSGVIRSGEWRALWTRLADAGVTALGTPEALGGFGADAVDLVIGFEELGRAAVPGPLAESVAVLPALLAGTPDEPFVAELASGAAVATLAAPDQVPYAVDAALADRVYLLNGPTLSRAEVSIERESVDKARRLAEVAATEPVATMRDVDAAFDLGALATSAQLLGLGAALLERATAYAQQRVQFGRPIGSYQAVKHQLADVAVALDLARPLVWGAAVAVRDGLDTRGRDVSAAKVAAGDAAYLAARVSLQVHGAIGYTAEYDLALWLTKVRALRSAWGTPAMHRARVLAAIS